MNEHIAKLAWRHLLPERYSRYGETIEGDHYDFEPEELQKFAELIVKKVFDSITNEGFEVYAPVEQKVKQSFGVE